MRTLALAALLPLALLTVACSGDDGPPLGGDVVGQWRELPNATDDDPPPAIDERAILTFFADGTVTRASNAGDIPEPATYEVSGGELTLHTTDGEGTTHTSTMPYFASDTRFVLGALIPAGEVDGLVGTWTGTVTNDDVVRTLNIELRADNTATYNSDSSVDENDVTFTGTWRSVGDDLELVLVPEENVTLHLRATRVGSALGSAYERI